MSDFAPLHAIQRKTARRYCLSYMESVQTELVVTCQFCFKDCSRKEVPVECLRSDGIDCGATYSVSVFRIASDVLREQ